MHDLTRERVRQLINKATKKIAVKESMVFDEDYFKYFYQTYCFDKKDAKKWLGLSEAALNYFDIFGIKQGDRPLESALEDTSGLETSLRLKIKNYLNRNRIFIDGMWIDKKRSSIENYVLEKFCCDEITFDGFTRIYNHFLEELEIPLDDPLFFTDSNARTRINRLADSRNVLWKQNEKLRYYDIDGRDFTELLETLHLDSYENIELSTLKFFNDYPEVMKRYDIRDHYELHNLLKKITPEGSYHGIVFKRMPQIIFGSADRNTAVFELMTENAPVTVNELVELARAEYGYDYTVCMMAAQSFSEYLHNGVYSIDYKHMSEDRVIILQKSLTDDFYYIDEIKKKYAELFPDSDVQEINSYNLKRMGFHVFSKYVMQHYDSLYQYFCHLLVNPDMIDVTQYRKRFTYVQMFSQCLTELERTLQIIEYEPNKYINFRILEQEGVTRDTIQEFCDRVYESVGQGEYFTIRSLNNDGVMPAIDSLDELGFSEWFYSNLLLSDSRFPNQRVFGNIMFCKGRKTITIKSLILYLVHLYGSVDILDMIHDMREKFGCIVNDKSDIIYKIQDTEVYYDSILERLYANKDMYYDELESEGW